MDQISCSSVRYKVLVLTEVLTQSLKFLVMNFIDLPTKRLTFGSASAFLGEQNRIVPDAP
jgi:hypothetical protein